MPQKIANLIGLAGQSCAGKNLVAKFLEEKGYAVIDADRVAHTVLQEQSEAVIARFSPYAGAGRFIGQKSFKRFAFFGFCLIGGT